MPQKPSSSADRPVRRRLGRGLDSLIGSPISVDIPPAESVPDGKFAASRSLGTAGPPAGTSSDTPAAADRQVTDGLVGLAVSSIRPNPRQPRQQFDEPSLRALADSIRSAGLMQPVIVRPASADAGQFELIAGERRWRAAQIVGLRQIPAVVRHVDDETAAQWALIENLQREDLNPIERAEAFHRLAEDFRLTHQEIAERVGLDRTSITNHLRLLELEPQIREQIIGGGLNLGHGKALLAITNISARRRLAQEAARRQWSVRELERRVRRKQNGSRDGQPGSSPSRQQIHTQDLERKLGEHLGTKVHIRPGRKKGAGSLTIEFYSFEEFEGLLRRLKFDAR